MKNNKNNSDDISRNMTCNKIIRERYASRHSWQRPNDWTFMTSFL